MSSPVDMWMTYQFLKRFVMPFTQWKAYKLGVIDERGNIIKKSRNREEESSLGYFDKLVLKLKKLLAYVPGGSTMFGSLAAAYLLLREGDRLETLSEAEIMDRYDDMLQNEYFLEEWNNLGLAEEAPVNSVGSGAIAGVGVGPDGEPGVDLRKRQRRQLLIKSLVKRKAPWII